MKLRKRFLPWTGPGVCGVVRALWRPLLCSLRYVDVCGPVGMPSNLVAPRSKCPHQECSCPVVDTAKLVAWDETAVKSGVALEAQLGGTGLLFREECLESARCKVSDSCWMVRLASFESNWWPWRLHYALRLVLQTAWLESHRLGSKVGVHRPPMLSALRTASSLVLIAYLGAGREPGPRALVSDVSGDGYALLKKPPCRLEK